MNDIQLRAFSDEMEKISRSFLRDVALPFVSGHGTRLLRYSGEKMRNWGSSLASMPIRTGQAVGDIVTSPVKTMRQGWHATWNDPVTSGGTIGRGMFALGTAGAAASAIPKDDPMQRGESRLTRGLRFAGGTAAGIAGMKRGVLPSIALSIGGDVAGGAVGRKIDKMRGYKPRVKPTGEVPAAMPQRLAQPAQVLAGD